MMASVDVDYIFKVLVIGDSSVGKSNLLLRFSDNIFHETFLPTIGVDFKIKNVTVKDKSVKLNIWDTAGQERFKTITAAYYKGAHGILVVFDITDRESFNNVTNWLNEIKKNAGVNVVKILIGNKSDLESGRKVSFEEANKMAESQGMVYLETSAKNRINVDESFMELTKSIYEQLPEKDKMSKGEGQKINGTRRPVKSGGCC